MKPLLAALAALLALGAAPARAQSDAEHLLDAVFQMFDENRDGVIAMDEASRFIDRTFAEMDVKHTGKITPDAWMRFSFGLADLAAAQGRSDAYDRAKYRIFKRWDRGNSGALSLEAYRAGVLGDARKAQGAKAGQELRIDFAAFKRAPFMRQLVSALR
jgi:Ca2+-binding EF-hand superfamily protein